MDSPILILITIRLGLSIIYFKGSLIEISKLYSTSTSAHEDYFTLENSSDPDEMLNFLVFHLGLQKIIFP